MRAFGDTSTPPPLEDLIWVQDARRISGKSDWWVKQHCGTIIQIDRRHYVLKAVFEDTVTTLLSAHVVIPKEPKARASKPTVERYVRVSA